MKIFFLLLTFFISVASTNFINGQHQQQKTTFYNISDILRPNRVFDGIGGLSGGGATSVLLWTYPEPQRSQILDYLFLPNFGASLHILKVEIGAGEQSTDGSEAGHMYTPTDEVYTRGYEWWLMTEAKKRNPKIKIYALAWGYPQWVTCSNFPTECTGDIYSFPHQTATYITKWVQGAKREYGVFTDYIGIWNERQWNDTYIEILRATLDAAGFPDTKIVAPDNAGWSIASDILNSKNGTLGKAIFGIGSHYPGTFSTPDAEKTGKQLWASEDDSTYNNAVGAACWARIINQNYVNGNMSASINWNLIASYQAGTNWYRAGISSAMTPWNGASYGTFNGDGSWTMGPMLWATAHTTQFSFPDGNWAYLHQQQKDSSIASEAGGSGLLKKGGSYVTLKNFKTNDFTIVLEKMTRDFSSCVRPVLLPYETEDEEVTLFFGGNLLHSSTKLVTHLHLWKTHFAHFPDDKTEEFFYQGIVPIDPATSSITLNVTRNSLYTLTTIPTGKKGSHGRPAAIPSLFPTTYADNFDDCRITGEAKYFTDQSGAFECVKADEPERGVVMQQKVPLAPVGWVGGSRPHTLIGHRYMAELSISIDAKILSAGHSFVLGTRCQHQNDVYCNILHVSAAASNNTTNNKTSFAYIQNRLDMILPPFATIEIPFVIRAGEWHTYRMDINFTDSSSTSANSVLNVWIDGNHLLQNLDVSSWTTNTGWGMLGTGDFGFYTQYDNLQLYSSYYENRHDNAPNPASTFSEGDPVCVAQCSSEIGVQASSQWNFNVHPSNENPGSKNNKNKLKNSRPTSGLIQLKANPSLCISAVSSSSSKKNLQESQKRFNNNRTVVAPTLNLQRNGS